MKSKPTILITNDDGINAKGIHELTASLQAIGNIVVFAPDGPRSGMSAAITSTMPLRYRKVGEEGNAIFYKCTGTPVDCVKLAIHTGTVKPDIVVSGINHGGNMAVCVHYSGTLGAATEACIIGIPAIGISLANHHHEDSTDFRESCRLGKIVVEYVLREGLPNGTYLNLNVPPVPSVKGIRVCRQADSRFINEYMETECPGDEKAYWLTGPMHTRPPLLPDYDTVALDEGFASLVPCKIDVTDFDLIDSLRTALQ
jgi:5'-nucleotidase